jgi:segregation and condensation protein B
LDDVRNIIEALIFASDIPLSSEKLTELLEDVEKKVIEHHLAGLVAEYGERCGGICLQEVAGGFQFRTKSEFAPWVKKLKGLKSFLTPAAMETLAVIAYRQPVLKFEIDNIRGVDAGGPIKRLLEKNLVRIVGRKDVPGKPIIYGTTKKFLEVFNLKDLSELPTLKELKELEG